MHEGGILSGVQDPHEDLAYTKSHSKTNQSQTKAEFSTVLTSKSGTLLYCKRHHALKWLEQTKAIAALVV